MPAKISLIGQTFGRLKVISQGPHKVFPYGKKQIQSFCRCICGNVILVLNQSLRTGTTTSCGCFHRQMVKNRFTTHGHTLGKQFSPTYYSWSCMITRCTNTKATSYKNYGGRGIKVCNRWKNSFEHFLEDMGERPQGKTLDRWPNKNGNYEPGNCRWATAKQQGGNTRRVPIYVFNGVSNTLPNLCKQFGMAYNRVRARLLNGWTFQKAFSTTKHKNQFH